MLGWLLVGCGVDTAVDVDQVTNRWWHLLENNMNIYLEQEDGAGQEGTLWYDFVGPDVPLEDNWYGGEWTQVSERRFSLDFFGQRYRVRAEASEAPGCYDLFLGIFAKDLACPYVDHRAVPDEA